MTEEVQINLIGAPNVGKTSLFNYLTGKNNLIGNWDGVTSDITKASFNYADHIINVKDLPGCYSLISSLKMSMDEELVCKYLHANQPENQIFINVISLENLQRDLYLTLQLLERSYKMIILLNVYNYSPKNNLSLEQQKLINHLQSTLNCKVLACNVSTGYMLQELKSCILLKYNLNNNNKYKLNNNNLLYKYIPENIITNLEYLLKTFKFNNLADLIRYLEGDVLMQATYKELYRRSYKDSRKNLYKEIANNLKFLSINSWDVFFASRRHDFINNYLLLHFKNISQKPINLLTDKLDAIFLHKYYGLLIFVSVIYIMFYYINKFGNLLQQYFNESFITICINPVAKFLNLLYFPDYLIKLFNEGIAVGVGTLFNFIPILFLMNICLLFLENCGYMIRVVVLLDKLMGFLGLSGKSIIPMIIGFSCNVPAINGAKVISNKRDKIITILMTPFMSCNARLVTYSFFATAFFKYNKSNIIFYLYLIGIIFGIFTGFLLNKILHGTRENLFIELPKYNFPSIKLIIKLSCYKIKNFISNAGSTIIFICSLIAMVKLFNLDFYNLLDNKFCKSIILIFKPLGIEMNNWPAIASLFSGLIAKEAIIGSLYSYYYTNSQEIFGILCTKFGDYKSAFAYLLFVLLSFPCISVVTSIAKELGKGWAVFSMIWTTWLAYFVSGSYYQLATFNKHPIYSLEILLLMFSLFALLLLFTKMKISSLNLQEKFQQSKLIPLVID